MDKNSVAALAMAPKAVGITSLVAGIIPYFESEFIAAGLFFIAAALSFGLLSIGLLKD